jgi:hypothetical protein
MSPRAAVLLALAAMALYAVLGVARPAWDEAARARAGEARALSEGRAARMESMRAQRTLRSAGAQSVSGRVPPGAGDVRAVRRRILQLLDQAQARKVTLDVQAASATQPGVVRLSAEGDFAALVELSAQLSAPETGLVLEQARLGEQPGGALRLELIAAPRGATP